MLIKISPFKEKKLINNKKNHLYFISLPFDMIYVTNSHKNKHSMKQDFLKLVLWIHYLLTSKQNFLTGNVFIEVIFLVCYDYNINSWNTLKIINNFLLVKWIQLFLDFVLSQEENCKLKEIWKHWAFIKMVCLG